MRAVSPDLIRTCSSFYWYGFKRKYEICGLGADFGSYCVCRISYCVSRIADLVWDGGGWRSECESFGCAQDRYRISNIEF